MTFIKTQQSNYREIMLRPLKKRQPDRQVSQKAHKRPRGRSSPNSFPLSNCDFGLGPVQNFLELGNAMAHTRMHVSFGTLDVIVQVITEQLNVGDGGRRHIRVGEMPREQHKRDVTDIFRRLESRHTAQLQWRVAIGV